MSKNIIIVVQFTLINAVFIIAQPEAAHSTRILAPDVKLMRQTMKYTWMD
jgi:uncharacterized membrane protein